MNEETRNRMLQDYSKLHYRGPLNCIKYNYTYNGVAVSLYFDAYDEKSMQLTMILKTENEYYLTSLNIMNARIRKEYLLEIPYVFLKKILVNNELNDFYFHMENMILKSEPIIATYQKDFTYTKTLEKKKEEVKIDLPFWHHIRHARMSDRMLEELSERADISRKTLYTIQRKGFTLVRTDDASKRCKLKLILKDIGIELD